MNKYIEELVTEIYFEICDLSYGQTYKDIGYDNKKDFYAEMKIKMTELIQRLESLEKEPPPTVTETLKEFFESQDPVKLMGALK